MSRPEESATSARAGVAEDRASEGDPRFDARSDALASGLIRLSTLTALAALAGSALVLVGGWALGIGPLTSAVPGEATTKPNTAICIALLSLALLARQRSVPRARAASMGCAGAALAIAAVSLAEHTLGWNAGIDELLFRDTMSQAATLEPGRMAPNTAAVLILLAGALIAWEARLRSVRPTNVLAFLGGLTAFMALLGNVTDTNSLAAVSDAARMALPTTILALLLAVAIVLSRPDRGLAAILASPGPGGHALRRALPFAVLVPLLLAWARWRAQDAGLIGTRVGIWVSAALIVGLSVVLIVAIARSLERTDVERRRAERGLRALIELAPDAIVVIDGAGAITRLNAQAERLLGYRREELIGAPVETLVPEGLREADRSHQREFAREPHVRWMGQNRELHARRRDGGEVPVEIGLSPVTLEGRAQVIAAIRDVTERRRAERAREEAERAKDEFLTLVSHELRTPLTSILVSAELAAEQGADRLGEEARGYIEVIRRNAKREMRLVADLLLLVQIQEGKFRMELGEVDLAEVVANAVEAARPVAEQRSLAISSQAAAAPLCNGDFQRLEQAIDNLIANAIKFTPPGGSVDVRLTARDGEAAIEVSDTGVGIPEGERGRLFERLFRGAGASAAGVPGLGLGLTIVRAIAEAHGGRIEVDSTVGAGTTFRLLLPARVPRGSAERSADLAHRP